MGRDRSAARDRLQSKQQSDLGGGTDLRGFGAEGSLEHRPKARVASLSAAHPEVERNVEPTRSELRSQVRAVVIVVEAARPRTVRCSIPKRREAGGHGKGAASLERQNRANEGAKRHEGNFERSPGMSISARSDP